MNENFFTHDLEQVRKFILELPDSMGVQMKNKLFLSILIDSDNFFERGSHYSVYISTTLIIKLNK